MTNLNIHMQPNWLPLTALPRFCFSSAKQLPTKQPEPPQQPSKSFADLPAELRNQIYNYTLVRSAPIELPYAYEKAYFREPALLAANSWVRAEALPIFYGCNIFETPSPPSAHRFLKQLAPENIARIRLFRPIDLILPLSVHRRWSDALRGNLNRLVADSGKGALSSDAVHVPIRNDAGEASWCKLDAIEDFKIVPGSEGRWSIEWRETS
ncbi:hypothetical protein CLAFUW4_12036 [Fulvia fulva]|uniref:Uncharacterized protein n=1 Tax=Passalora fulva TaxID=5499 RepID=A0A9Q8UT20_PASFU|nr:uncharacterized protein CLAFUR5_11075 [Fulvia fulva]KAK4617795.1 hypothetical protein CLAFUR4_12041 [Fulvia fulva]KAK4618833.1 hypothetical protein CLAFUR0_12052 [Fulvia fulva]UJO21357.1 hypothetical protein CLAFUR5_11075 [Fulvia fulva]WPV18047.1 hypothetical protein CLAFUW4_12036 [Fulvia fulva]WPV32777.1 hypothetical protein CLAFUW7_12043 [Fulvia fulva]